MGIVLTPAPATSLTAANTCKTASMMCMTCVRLALARESFFSVFFHFKLACLLAPLSLVPFCEIMDPCAGHPTFQSLACCACTLCVDHLYTSGTQARCSHERGEASSSGLTCPSCQTSLPLLRASRSQPTRHRPLPHHMSCGHRAFASLGQLLAVAAASLMPHFSRPCAPQ